MREMRDAPERFGALRTLERRRALGLLREVDDGPAGRAAELAAGLGGAALAAERAAWATAADIAARRLEDAFARQLRDLYEQPTAARGAFGDLVRRHDVEHAVAVLREHPEQLGPLRVAVGREPASARSIADRAAALGLEAARASTSARSDDVTARGAMLGAERVTAERAFAREDVDRTSDHERGVRCELATLPGADALRARIGRAADRLLPSEARRLKTLVSAPQLALAMQLRAAVRDAVLGRDDERT
jgi:hypothetical protein